MSIWYMKNILITISFIFIIAWIIKNLPRLYMNNLLVLLELNRNMSLVLFMVYIINIADGWSVYTMRLEIFVCKFVRLPVSSTWFYYFNALIIFKLLSFRHVTKEISNDFSNKPYKLHFLYPIMTNVALVNRFKQ